MYWLNYNTLAHGKSCPVRPVAISANQMLEIWIWSPALVLWSWAQVWQLNSYVWSNEESLASIVCNHHTPNKYVNENVLRYTKFCSARRFHCNHWVPTFRALYGRTLYGPVLALKQLILKGNFESHLTGKTLSLFMDNNGNLYYCPRRLAPG
jgi:hypothetical protein